jgi:hypothetical protein
MDVFNIPLGALEGTMAAIPSNVNNYFCSLNATSSRKNLQSFTDYMINNKTKDAVTQFYQFL